MSKAPKDSFVFSKEEILAIATEMEQNKTRAYYSIKDHFTGLKELTKESYTALMSLYISSEMFQNYIEILLEDFGENEIKMGEKEFFNMADLVLALKKIKLELKQRNLSIESH